MVNNLDFIFCYKYHFKLFKNLLFIYFFLIFSIVTLYAEFSPWSVSLKLGSIRNLQFKCDDLPIFSIYSEIDIEKRFFEKEKKEVAFLSGLFYFGYWDDFIRKESTVFIDNYTYSYSCFSIGGRIMINAKLKLIQASLLGGISRHFIYSDYIGGFGILGKPGKDGSFKYNSFDLGIRFRHSIYDKFQLEFECMYLFPMGRDGYEVRDSYKFGINYRI